MQGIVRYPTDARSREDIFFYLWKIVNSHPLFSLRIRDKSGLVLKWRELLQNALCSSFLSSFLGTVSCQKCVTSSSPPHLIWIKLKLLPYQSVHTFFPFSLPRTAITKLDKLLISTKVLSTPFRHQRPKGWDELKAMRKLRSYSSLQTHSFLQAVFLDLLAANEDLLNAGSLFMGIM